MDTISTEMNVTLSPGYFNRGGLHGLVANVRVTAVNQAYGQPHCEACIELRCACCAASIGTFTCNVDLAGPVLIRDPSIAVLDQLGITEQIDNAVHWLGTEVNKLVKGP